jgi:type II secretory pathway component PulF
MQSGESEAESASRLAEQLRASGWVVLGIEEVRGRAARGDGLPPYWNPAWLVPVTSLDIELGFRQLASMLRSGVSILAALKTVALQSGCPRAAAVWLDLEGPQSAAARTCPTPWPATRAPSVHVTQLIRVGENSGEMDTS